MRYFAARSRLPTHTIDFKPISSAFICMNLNKQMARIKIITDQMRMQTKDLFDT
jgi:hypothetical protein